MMAPGSTKTYQVHGVGRPGGHGSIRCNTTTVKADTGSVSDGFRPGPAELLCASLAACLLKNIERFSEMLPFDYEVASVTVEAERQDSPPKIVGMTYHIEVATNEPDHRVELLHRNIIKFGTITNTLAAVCDVTGDLIAHRGILRPGGSWPGGSE
ncbi:MAG: OsmC family protein [Acidimicrobiia bacterium]